MLLTELDLSKTEPTFLWRSPLAYVIEGDPSNRALELGRYSRAHRLSIGVLFTVLGLFGVTGIILGWPLYVALVPIFAAGFGFLCSSVGQKQLAGCRIEVKPDGVTIVTPADRLQLRRLVEVRVMNRWKRRDESFIPGGDSELFLAVEETPGQKRFFPLAKSGVLRGLDGLAADIASLTGCRVHITLVE